MGTEPNELHTLVGDNADKRREWRGTPNSACKGEACFTGTPAPRAMTAAARM